MNQEDNALSLAANWHFVCSVCVPEEEVSNVSLTIVCLQSSNELLYAE